MASIRSYTTRILAWALLGWLFLAGVRLGMSPADVDWNRGYEIQKVTLHQAPPIPAFSSKRGDSISGLPVSDSAGLQPIVSADSVSISLSRLIYPELELIAEAGDDPIDESIQALTYWSTDPDPVIRRASVESMADLDESAITTTLVQIAISDPDRQTRLMAIDAIALQSDAAALSGLEPLLYESDPAIRIAALEVMADLEHPATVMSLSSLLGDADPRVRHHAVAALGEIDDPSTRGYLVTMLADPDECIRNSVINILRENYPADF